jgi:TonB family protein
MKAHAEYALLALAVVFTNFMAAKAQQQETVTDDQMKVVSFEDFSYPPLARNARIEGVVVVKVELDDQGNVTDSTAISGTQPLIPSCLTNSKKWRFRPNPRKTAIIVYDFRVDSGWCQAPGSVFAFHPPNFVTVTTCQSVPQPAGTAGATTIPSP